MNLKRWVLNLSLLAVTCLNQPVNAQPASTDYSPIIVTTVIKSTMEKVWDVMIDFDNYSAWNKWVVKMEGEAKEGARVVAYSESGASLQLKITNLQAPHTICWVDVTWFTHLGVGGWRCRTIAPNPDGEGVLFTNHFEYTGIFHGVLDYFSRNALKKGMQLENESLRDFVE
jgi:hypothetical protein